MDHDSHFTPVVRSRNPFNRIPSEPTTLEEDLAWRRPVGTWVVVAVVSAAELEDLEQLAFRFFEFAPRLQAGESGIFLYGPQQASVPFGNGFLCIAGQIGRLDVVNATGNVMTFLVDNTSPPSAATQITAGSTWSFQAWFRDPAAGGAFFDLSDGLSVTFGP